MRAGAVGVQRGARRCKEVQEGARRCARQCGKALTVLNEKNASHLAHDTNLCDLILV